MPLVARHHTPKHRATLEARRSCLYMAPRALATPGPKPTSNATAMAMAWGMKSKHLTQLMLTNATAHPFRRRQLQENLDHCGAEAKGT